MSLDLMRYWIESTLQDQIAITYPHVDIRFTNATLLQPESAWIRLVSSDRHAYELGVGSARCERHEGSAHFEVMVPQRSGTSQANKVAEFIGNLLRYQDIALSDGARLRFQAPQYPNLGTQGGFHRRGCVIPYIRDEMH